MLNDEHGDPLFSYHPNKPLIPASVIKIATALASIDILGEEYHFATEFFLDNRSRLAIKGWGDPFLVSEEIDRIAVALKKRGVNQIESIGLDSGSFLSEIRIPGTSHTQNPYDALNGALVVNFNTLNLRKDDKGKLFSAEEETPLTPLAYEKFKSIEAGETSRVNLTDQPEESLRYAGELFMAFFTRRGIVVRDRTVFQIDISNDKAWSLIYRHNNSRSLTSIMKGLLKYSNNFIANQVFLVAGSRLRGFPASLPKSRWVFENYFRRELGISPPRLVINEASGISRNNRVTGEAMIKILERFKDRAELLTMKKGKRVKSGTLTHVYNYAGYLIVKNGLRPFVILMNQKRNTRDKVLGLLSRYSACFDNY